MRRCSASWRWCGVILRGRPKRTPRSLARLRPSPALARISSRSQTQARKVARELLKRADTIVKHAQTGTTPLELARVCKAWRAFPPALPTLARVRLQRLSPIGTAEIHRRGPKMQPTFSGRARGGQGPPLLVKKLLPNVLVADGPGERIEYEHRIVGRGGIQLRERRQAVFGELRGRPPAHRCGELAGLHGLGPRAD